MLSIHIGGWKSCTYNIDPHLKEINKKKIFLNASKFKKKEKFSTA